MPTDDPPYPYPPLILHKGMEVVSWLCKGVISLGVVVVGCWPQNVGRGGVQGRDKQEDSATRGPGPQKSNKNEFTVICMGKYNNYR